jgi:hypothetical protein
MVLRVQKCGLYHRVRTNGQLYLNKLVWNRRMVRVWGIQHVCSPPGPVKSGERTVGTAVEAAVSGNWALGVAGMKGTRAIIDALFWCNVTIYTVHVDCPCVGPSH